MYIALFKDSHESFTRALADAGVPFEERTGPAGQIRASGTAVTIAQTAAAAGALATVLVAWLRARASRKVMLTLQDSRVVHLEGYSVEQVKELLQVAAHGTAIDTQPSDEDAA